MGTPRSQRALVVLLAATLAAFGGTYRSSTIPILIGSAIVYALSRRARRRRAPDAGEQVLDASLTVVIIAVALQLAPLPPFVVSAVTPHAAAVRAALRLDAPLHGDSDWWPITLDSTAGWHALATWAAAVLTFWAARRTFAFGGARAFCRAVGWIGLAACLIAVAQRATAPHLLYGAFETGIDGATPFGPYVNRNLFAGWLIIAIPLVTGYLASHLRVHLTTDRRGVSQDLRLLLRSGAATVGLIVLVMAVTLLITLSRSGMVGLAAAAAAGWWLARKRRVRNRTFTLVFVLLAGAFVLFATAYGNPLEVIARFESFFDPAPHSRLAVWKETGRVVHDFWLTGTGTGAFARAMLLYQQSDRAFFINFAHNQYLQLAAEGGVLLSLPVLVSAALFIRLACRRLATDATELYWMRAGACAAMIASLVQALWEWPLEMPGNNLLFAAAAGLLIAPRRSHDSASNDYADTHRQSALNARRA